jgi:hypothetical protein
VLIVDEMTRIVESNLVSIEERTHSPAPFLLVAVWGIHECVGRGQHRVHYGGGGGDGAGGEGAAEGEGRTMMRRRESQVQVEISSAYVERAGEGLSLKRRLEAEAK